MAELRWILAALGALLLAGIWWWGARRARQVPGNATLREAAPVAVQNPLERVDRTNYAGNAYDADDADTFEPPARIAIDPERGEWGVSPFEPLSIRTAEFEALSVEDLPMSAHAERLEVNDAPVVEPFAAEPPPLVRVPTLRSADIVTPAASLDTRPTFEPERRAPAAQPADAYPVDATPTLTESRVVAPTALSSEATPPATARAAVNAAETQRIVSVRVAAAEDARWPGPHLLAALEDHGLAYGRYQVFHRKHSDGRTLFCAASLVEPGTFNLDDMPQDEFRGLTLFAVLPGPIEPLPTLDALIDTANQLARTLHGVVQDSKGVPLIPQRASALREEVARFQASLSIH